MDDRQPGGCSWCAASADAPWYAHAGTCPQRRSPDPRLAQSDTLYFEDAAARRTRETRRTVLMEGLLWGWLAGLVTAGLLFFVLR